jgi:predicted nucleic acid-binding protein
MAVNYLLDTSVLLAAGWSTHSEHVRVCRWIKGKDVLTCSIVEVGFLRISAQPSGPFKATMAQAKALLADLFKDARSFQFLPDDLHGSDAPDTATAASVGDWHLAELAHRHGLRFASLDTRIKHPAVEVV